MTDKPTNIASAVIQEMRKQPLPVVDRVAMNALMVANAKQAAVTKMLRERETLTAATAKEVADELRTATNGLTAERCAELAKILNRITRLTRATKANGKDRLLNAVARRVSGDWS